MRPDHLDRIHWPHTLRKLWRRTWPVLAGAAGIVFIALILFIELAARWRIAFGNVCS